MSSQGQPLDVNTKSLTIILLYNWFGSFLFFSYHSTTWWFWGRGRVEDESICLPRAHRGIVHSLQKGIETMNRFRLLLGLISVCFMAAQPSWAATVYVSDSFEITLRTGPSIENRIIAMPSSGQTLETLDIQGDWTQVRMHQPDGSTVEGWVLNRYLMTRLSWEARAKALKEKNASLREKLASTEKRLKEVTGREQDLAGKLKEKIEALENVQTNYDSLRNRSADYLKLESAYKENRSKLETAEERVARLTKEIEQLHASKKNRWFLTGALVLLFGLLIGLLIGRQQRKRRSSYY
jgi:SH3 domain protein